MDPQQPSTWTGPVSFSWAQPLDASFDQFLRSIKLHDTTASSTRANQTVKQLTKYIKLATSLQTITIEHILLFFGIMNSVISEARPAELVVVNIILRLMNFLRQSHSFLPSEQQLNDGSDPSSAGVNEANSIAADTSVAAATRMATVYSIRSDFDLYKNITIAQVSEDLLGLLEELTSEIEDTAANVAKHASSYIFPNESVLTYGCSKTLLQFFKSALVHTTFTVYVAESAPSLSGRLFARELASGKSKVKVILIPDSDIYSIMPVVTKVFIGAHAVLANGGILAHIGANNLCFAAAHTQAPVVVLTGTYKLSKQYAFDQTTFNEQLPPSSVLPFDETFEGRVDIISPSFDYVAPEKISLFITDSSCYPPSCVYRNVQELYSQEDYLRNT